MAFTPSQRGHLGRYLLDISKLIVGIYVFTSLPDKPLQFVLGCLATFCFLIGGLWFLKTQS